MTAEDLTLPDGYAAPTCGGAKYENWKLNPKGDDSLVLRLLPAMGSQARSGNLGLFWGLHFGWQGRNVSDPTKRTYRPFLCVEEKRNGMVTKPCAACNYIAEYKKKWDASKAEIAKKVEEIRAAGAAAGKTEQEINRVIAKKSEEMKKAAESIYQWLYDHSCNKKVRIPAINRQGQFGIFSVSYGLYKKLGEEMKKLTARTYPGTNFQVQPAGRKGVWFEFTRKGKPSKDSDNVSPVRIQQSDGSEILDFHTITNEQLIQAKDAIPDLAELMEASRIRPDQIEALVQLDRDGGGSADPDEVDKIFNDGKTADGGDPDWLNATESTKEEQLKPEPAKEAPKQPEPVKAAPQDPKPQPEPAKEAPKAASAPVQDDDFESMFA